MSTQDLSWYLPTTPTPRVSLSELIHMHGVPRLDRLVDLIKTVEGARGGKRLAPLFSYLGAYLLLYAFAQIMVFSVLIIAGTPALALIGSLTLAALVYACSGSLWYRRPFTQSDFYFLTLDERVYASELAYAGATLAVEQSPSTGQHFLAAEKDGDKSYIAEWSYASPIAHHVCTVLPEVWQRT